MSLDVLKTYLVKIKHEVDKASQDKAIAQIDTTKSKIGNLISFTSSGIIKSSAIVVSSLMTVNSLLAKTVLEVSEADVAAERFARKMWTTEKNARAMLTALDAVGSSDFSDIYNMTPEEFERLMQLRNLSLSLEAPSDTQKTLVLIRDIVHELDKLQVILSYAKQWFVYAFGKYAGKDLNELKKNFENFNNMLMQKLPQITDKVAKLFYIFYRLGSAAIFIIKQLGSFLFDLLDRLPGKALAAGAGITAFLGLLKLGPLGAFIMALTALLLLVDDYMVWKKGGKSLLGDSWEKLDSAMNDENSSLNKLKNIFYDIMDVTGIILTNIVDAIAKTIEWADEAGILEGIFKGIEDIIDDLALLVSGIKGAVSGTSEALDMFGKFANGEITRDEYLNWLGKDIVDDAGAINDWLSQFFGMDNSKFYVDPETGKIIAGNMGYTEPFYSGGNNSTITYTNYNNINVTQSRNETARGTGITIAKEIAKNRNDYNPILV